ncbi:hypothetical protein GGI12_003877 [Dipsacomyces acuminosporus]|nr:hypothetical protein GGI12_003877 [Dipsacomyces acuminosporus]
MPLNLDETELTGICFSFRSYVSDRVQRICDRQSDLVIAAKHASARSTDSSSRLSYVTQLAKQDREGVLAKQDREGVVLLKSLQRQAEKSYELMQEILHDLERLEVVLPANERFFGSNSAAPKEFPNLSKMLHQRRRNSLPSNSPSLGTIMRRQMASKKTGIPAFRIR